MPLPPLPPAPVQPWPHSFPPPIILPPEQPARFQLGPASLATLAVCVLIHLRVGAPHWVRTPLAASQDIGVFVFGFLLAIAVAWVCWRIKPRKHAGEFVFCFLLLLFAGGRLTENVEAASKARVQAAQALDRQRVQTASRVSHAATPAPAAPVTAVEREAQVVPPAAVPSESDAGRTRNPDLRKMAAMAAVAGNIQVKVRAYEEAAARLKAAGGGSGRGLDSLAAIARRRQLTQEALNANTAATVACQSAENDLFAALRQVSPEEARQIARTATGGMELTTTLGIRDCERRCLEGIDGELSLFQQEFTRWHLDADGKLVFDNPAVNPWYTRWATQLREAAGEGTRLRREMTARHPAGRQ